MISHSANASGRPQRPIVVKLGGSLAESGRLKRILKIIDRARVPLVVVPGGGAFADAVRDAQGDHGFSDAAAHQMAQLAMHQTGLMLAALEARFTPAEGIGEIKRALAERCIPVWLPLKMTQRDRHVRADWTTTSDGLAARLAERLGRVPVVLVKSCRIAPGTTLAALVRKGVVDQTFAEIVARAGLAWRVLGAGEEEELAALLEARDAGRRRNGPVLSPEADGKGRR